MTDNLSIREFKNSNGTFDYWIFDLSYSKSRPVCTFIDVNKDSKSILNEFKKGYNPKKIKTIIRTTEPIETKTVGIKSTKENLEKVFNEFFGD